MHRVHLPPLDRTIHLRHALTTSLSEHDILSYWRSSIASYPGPSQHLWVCMTSEIRYSLTYEFLARVINSVCDKAAKRVCSYTTVLYSINQPTGIVIDSLPMTSLQALKETLQWWQNRTESLKPFLLALDNIFKLCIHELLFPYHRL